MNKKGYTTESGGRQNGFAIEPEINPISEVESKFAAKKAFYSEVFQKYLQSRDLMELVTISTL